MILSNFFRFELLQLLDLLQHFLVVLVQLAQVDHLEVRDHLWVLLV